MPILPNEPDDEEQLEELPQDGQTPFRPAPNEDDEAVIDPDADELVPTESEESPIPSSEAGGLDDTHPETDINIVNHEQYDEGVSGAAEASEPNVNDAVIGYSPPNDAKRKRSNRRSSPSERVPHLPSQVNRIPPPSRRRKRR